MQPHNHKTHEEIWEPDEAELSAALMIRRIRVVTASRVWRHGARFLAQRNVPANQLRLAEVGCGTGTYSLTLGLLGASVTLIDFNERVLERAKRIYGDFGCAARWVRADCLDPVPADLEGKFDLVISGGLAEHFTGAYRERCFSYHRLLLREGGMAIIGVPNRWSPFYQWIRVFRAWTGTWGLDVEIPYSNIELKRLAKKAGFREYYVIGGASLWEDFWVYSRGFISAIADLCPRGLSEKAREWKTGIENRSSSPSDPRAYALEYCRDRWDWVRQEARDEPHSALSDWLSAGIGLVGFR